MTDRKLTRVDLDLIDIALAKRTQLDARIASTQLSIMELRDELENLAAARDGLSNRRIGATYGVSDKTIRRRLEHRTGSRAANAGHGGTGYRP